MNFHFLSENLHDTALASKSFIKNRFGISKFNVEQSIHKSIGYGPTIHGKTKENYIFCIEVRENINRIHVAFNEFISECMRNCLPVKIIIAIPKGVKYSSKELKNIKKLGLGLLEADKQDSYLAEIPTNLHLSHVRPIEFNKYPIYFREKLHEADSTFKNTSPVKGCLIIYEEIEYISRIIAEEAIKKDFLKKNIKLPKKFKNLNFKIGSWAIIIQFLMGHFDYKKAKCPQLNTSLLARILGLTSHRNDAGHKPQSLEKLKERDIQLRTRYETSFDILLELINACKPIKRFS